MAELNYRWRTYPTDRELILRSRINVGWSVHSHRVFRRLEPLSDSEMDFIQHVLSRAQEMEMHEQQRIGSMVERLENIKKNTLENGPMSCAMCGVPFGWLKSSIFTCYDCTKSVCNKCCVDTYSVAHDPCMLCKICAEERELWKKSGGWFYRSLPTYVKPERKLSTSPSVGRATWEHRKPDIVRLESFEATESENNNERFLKSSWANLSIHAAGNEVESPVEFKMTSNIFGGTDFGFLKPVSDNMRREASFHHLAAPEANLNLLSMSSMSTSCPSLAPDPVTTKSLASHPNSSGVLEFSVTYNSKSQVLQITIFAAKGMDVKNNDEEMTYVKVYPIPFSKKMNTLRTKSVRKENTVKFHETLAFAKIRPEKLRKRILRFQVLEEDPFDDRVIGEVSVDLSEVRAVESKFFALPLKENDSILQKATECGWILLSLKYSPEDHTLVLRTIRCSDLVPSNKAALLNSFARVKLLPEFGDEKYETAVKYKTLNPRYNEEFTFHLSPLEMKRKSLMISVLEKTGKHSRDIGHVVLGIQARAENLQHWLEVLKKPKIHVEKWHALLKEKKYAI